MIIGLVEGLTFIADADGEAVGVDDDGDIDLIARLPSIGVLDDVGTGFVNGNFKLFDGVLGEVGFLGMRDHEVPHILKVARRTRDCEGMDGASHRGQELSGRCQPLAQSVCRRL